MKQLLSPKTFKNKQRVGRGYGSGRGGHTSGRGQKGQGSRSGNKRARPGFEGGSMPLSRRIPKLRGFSRTYTLRANEYTIVTLEFLDKSFKDGDVVTIDALISKGFNLKKSKNSTVKILANGEISKKLVIEGLGLSSVAKDRILKAGGEIK